MSHWETVYASGAQLNRYPYAEVVSFVKRLARTRPCAGLRALDVGCGSGVHALFLAEEGAEVTAFDGSPSAVAHAKSLHPHARIDYRVSTLADFDLSAGPFDLVIDRLSSIYAGVGGVTDFYQSLRSALAPGARLLWQGFDMENSGRSFGYFDPDIGAWTGFAEGVFAREDTIGFFTEADIAQTFSGYRFLSKRMLSDTNLETGYRHSYWNLELTTDT